MPGPMSAPLGYRDEQRGRAPRTGKTDVTNRGAIRTAVVDELGRFKSEQQEDE